MCSILLVAYQHSCTPLISGISVAYQLWVRHQYVDHISIISGRYIGGVPTFLYATDIWNISGVPVTGTPPIWLPCILKNMSGVEVMWYATDMLDISGVPPYGTPLICFLGPDSKYQWRRCLMVRHWKHSTYKLFCSSGGLGLFFLRAISRLDNILVCNP